MENSIPTQGLVIREPWIGHLCAGLKTWEMRGRATTKRGPIALIKAGSGLVVATATIADVLPPLDRTTMPLKFDKHRIPPENWRAADYSWFTPWVLTDIRVLARPIQYRHPSGAVTWVNLEADVVDEIERQIPSGRATTARPAARTGVMPSHMAPNKVETGVKPSQPSIDTMARGNAQTAEARRSATSSPTTSDPVASETVTAHHRSLAKRVMSDVGQHLDGIHVPDDAGVKVTRRGNKLYIDAAWDDGAQPVSGRLRRAAELIGTLSALAFMICTLGFIIHFAIGLSSSSVSALSALKWLVPMTIAVLVTVVCGQGHLLDDVLGEK